MPVFVSRVASRVSPKTTKLQRLLPAFSGDAVTADDAGAPRVCSTPEPEALLHPCKLRTKHIAMSICRFMNFLFICSNPQIQCGAGLRSLFASILEHTWTISLSESDTDCFSASFYNKSKISNDHRGEWFKCVHRRPSKCCAGNAPSVNARVRNVLFETHSTLAMRFIYNSQLQSFPRKSIPLCFPLQQIDMATFELA